MAWVVKGTKGPLLSILHTFDRQKVLVVLQHAHAISILRHARVVGEGSSKLAVLSGGPPLSLFHMFLLWFSLLGGSSVFLDVGPSILFLVFPLFRLLWLIFEWQGFII